MGCHSFRVNVLLHSEVSRRISRLDRAATWKKHVQQFYIGGHMTWMCASHGENFWDFLSSQELKVSLMYVHRAGFSQTASPLRCSGRGKGRVWRPGHTSLMQQKKKVSIASRITNTTTADWHSEAVCVFRALSADRGRRAVAAGGCWSDKGAWLRFKYFN